MNNKLKKHLRHLMGGTLIMSTSLATAEIGTLPGDLGEPTDNVVQLSYNNGETSPSTKTIHPKITIRNISNETIDISNLTLKYWYTDETSSTQLIDIYWISNGKAQGTFVSGEASDICEIAFSDGELRPDSSLKLHLGIHSQDWSSYDQSNDYSFAAAKSFEETKAITAYLNGKLVWGVEPDGISTPTDPTDPPAIDNDLSVSYKVNGSAGDGSYNPHFTINNNGQEAISYKDITMRYWFSNEDPAPLNFWINWAQMGGSKITGTFKELTSPVDDTADTYLELSFTDKQLAAGKNSGPIQTRFAKKNWSSVNETNDYSYDSSAKSYTENPKVALYYKGTLVWGKEPGSDDDDTTDPRPEVKALFSSTNLTGDAPFTIAFDAEPSTGEDLAYTWTFSDGTTSAGQTTVHTFTTPGIYTVKLVVTDGISDDEETAAIIVTEKLEPANQTPTAVISSTPTSGLAPLDTTFSASESTDPDGNTLTYIWDFDNGETSTDEIAQHTFTETGSYTVTLTVNDGELTNTATVQISVNDKDLPFTEGYKPKSARPPVTDGQVLNTLPGEKITVDVFADKELRLIPDTMYSNNLAIWSRDEYINKPEFKERILDAKQSILRFPGGSRSDTYHWNGIYPPYAVEQDWDVMSGKWAINTMEFLTFCEETGTTPLITANYGFSSYNTTATDGSVENAVQLAADWVEYCNSPNNGSNPNGGVDWAAQRAEDGHPEPFNVKYWEIGNEIYGKWETGYDAVGTKYGADYPAFHDAMKAVDPTISIGIVGYVGEKNSREWTHNVLSAPGTGERVDFIDIHDYFFYTGKGETISNEDLLTYTDDIEFDKSELDHAILTATNRKLGDIKYYFGEFHATNPTKARNVQLVSGLFITKCIGEMIEHDFDAASMWNISSGWKDSEKGELGFISRKNPDVPDYTPYPAYYPYYFFGNNFGDTLVESREDDPKLSVYASTFTSGEMGLMLVNESSSNKTITINLHDFVPSGDVNQWIMTSNSLSDTAITVNGEVNGYIYGGPLVKDIVPYYWSVAPGASTVTVNLEKYSATSIVLY